MSSTAGEVFRFVAYGSQVESGMDSQVVKCPSCGQSNRIPPLGSGKKAVCGKCGTELHAAPAAGGHPIDVTDANFAQTISKGKSVVDFWAAWCGPCRMIAPIIEELASSHSDVKFAKLNVDQNPMTRSQFRVQGIPLLVFFEDGQERGRLVGAAPRPTIESAIKQYLG